MNETKQNDQVVDLSEELTERASNYFRSIIQNENIENVAAKLRDELEKSIQGMTYRFDENLPIRFKHSNIEITHVQREWTLEERNRALIGDLRWIPGITTAQFRSFKGQIRRGEYGDVKRWLIKNGHKSIYDQWIALCHVKHHYMEGKIPVAFPDPVEVATVDIKVGDQNEKP